MGNPLVLLHTDAKTQQTQAFQGPQVNRDTPIVHLRPHSENRTSWHVHRSTLGSHWFLKVLDRGSLLKAANRILSLKLPKMFHVKATMVLCAWLGTSSPCTPKGNTNSLSKSSPLALQDALRFFSIVGDGSYKSSPKTSHKADNTSCTNKNGIQVGTVCSVFGSLIGIKAQYNRGKQHPFSMVRIRSLEMFPLCFPCLPARARPSTPEAPALVALLANC